jgi:N-acetylglucosamine kinase-like BadF-type ATPase
MRELAYVIGVDGGQTATRALIARPDLTVVGQGSGGPMVHFQSAGGIAHNRASIQAAIMAACHAAGVPLDRVRSIALGLTGVQLDAPEAPIVDGIVRELLSPTGVVVVPDYVTNLAGATRGEPGIVIIAGGGSIAYGVGASGRDALAGGYGYLLGDEGSGFDIGRQAARAAIRASEGRAAPTVLESAVKEHFQVSDMRQFFRAVYAAGFSRDRLSELTPLVARAAESGDMVALHIIRRAAHELARTCLAVIRKLHMAGERPSVYLSGGVWSAGEVIRKPFGWYLARCWGEVDVRTPLASPVEGAVILAAKQLAKEDS